MYLTGWPPLMGRAWKAAVPSFCTYTSEHVCASMLETHLSRACFKTSTCARQKCLILLFFRSYIEMFLKWPKEIKSFRSECLKINASEHCYGEFWHNCEKNDKCRSKKWPKCLSEKKQVWTRVTCMQESKEALTMQGYHERDEVLRQRMTAVKRDECDLQFELERLERERSLHIRELKRISNEDNSWLVVLRSVPLFGGECSHVLSKSRLSCSRMLRVSCLLVLRIRTMLKLWPNLRLKALPINNVTPLWKRFQWVGVVLLC